MHWLDPVTLAKVPGSQGSHLVLPRSEVKKPVAQERQVPFRPIAGMKVPVASEGEGCWLLAKMHTVRGESVAAPPQANTTSMQVPQLSPVGQVVHRRSVAFTSVLPDGQGSHLVAALATHTARPAGQERQRLAEPGGR